MVDNIKSVELVKPLKNEIVVRYLVTKRCNYHCPYCSEGQNKVEHPDNSAEVAAISKNINSVNKFLTEAGYSVCFILMGGEASVYDIKNLIFENLNFDYINRIRFTSNMSRPAEYYIDLHEYCKSKNTKFSMTASYHPTEVNQDDFIKKIEQIRSFVTVNLLITETEYYDVQEMVKKLTDKKIKIKVNAERKNKVQIDLTEPQLSLLRDHPDNAFTITYDDGHTKSNLIRADVLRELNDFTGYKCNIARKKIYIDEHGFFRKNCKSQVIDDSLNVSLAETDSESFNQRFSKMLMANTVCIDNHCQFCMQTYIEK